MDQLVQKLKAQERVIEALFIVHPQSSVLIKNKISTLQEEISQISTNFGNQLYTEWNDKIAALWQQFVTELNERTSSKYPIPRTKSIFDRDHIFQSPSYQPTYPFAPVSERDSFKDDISILHNLTNDVIIASPPPTYSEYFLNKILFNDSTNSKSKDNVGREIFFEFEQFTPVANTADHETMERLRLLVTKAQAKTIPFETKNDLLVFPTDKMNYILKCPPNKGNIIEVNKFNLDHQFVQLAVVEKANDVYQMKALLATITQAVASPSLGRSHDHIFDCAYAKLSAQLRDHYESMNQAICPPKSLYGLRKFIAILLAKNMTALGMGQSIDAIRSQMDHELGQCEPMSSDDDIESVKKLLVAVSKASRLTLNFPSDFSLNTALFDISFAKLCSSFKDKYDQNNGQLRSYRTLLNLQDFLMRQVTIFYKDYNIAQAQQIEAKRSLAKATTAKDTDARFCRYCKSIGHWYNECPEVQNMLCFKCFRPGHKAANCQCVVCFECSEPGHLTSNCPKVRCFRCHQIGHTEMNCALKLIS